ncbi:MAG: glucosyltransferase [Icmadophila ericetorum]|nr:glucosyltransferase [Icmadophila ericetorum]
MASPLKYSKILAFGYSTLFYGSVLAVTGVFWFIKVARNVPEPYLDEVFHIRQALAYYDKKFEVWDPKITTPAGLYVASAAFLEGTNTALRGILSLTTQLRLLNLVGGVYLIYTTCRSLLHYISKYEPGTLAEAEAQSKEAEKKFRAHVGQIDYTTLNICLFPPLFFFYSLFYTDVFSTFQVLNAHLAFYKGNTKLVLRDSIFALWFRQTNIFWTAIFLGGLQVVKTLKERRPGEDISSGSSFETVAQQSWQRGVIYDPLVGEANFEDYLKCGVSILSASLANLQLVLNALTPYILLLACFAGFVIWNGGVVLGDKENHTVSIHISQMLYLWPYITFFSLPLLSPYLLSLLPLPDYLRNYVPRSVPPRLLITIPILVLMTLIVHHNTLLHPFTLADNRHYTFYVFRILALRNPAIKYLAVPIYFLCAWAAISALGDSKPNKANANANTAAAIAAKKALSSSLRKPNKEPVGAKVSLLLILLLTTTLSLVAAPLVEPRYFILPWLLWRLHLPFPLPTSRLSPILVETTMKEGYIAMGLRILWENPLFLETMWFLLINLVTGYIFLNWGFEWPSEPGKVQRFMW